MFKVLYFKKNSIGQKVIPLMGTDYVSRLLFKVENNRIGFCGIAYKEHELFEINISSLLKNKKQLI